MNVSDACAHLTRIVDIWISSERAPSTTGANDLRCQNQQCVCGAYFRLLQDSCFKIVHQQRVGPRTSLQWPSSISHPEIAFLQVFEPFERNHWLCSARMQRTRWMGTWRDTESRNINDLDPAQHRARTEPHHSPNTTSSLCRCPSRVMFGRRTCCKRKLAFWLRSGASRVSGLFARRQDRWP